MSSDAEQAMLFRCTWNYRSRFAEILFNHVARERESRGVTRTGPGGCTIGTSTTSITFGSATPADNA